MGKNGKFMSFLFEIAEFGGFSLVADQNQAEKYDKQRNKDNY